MACELTLEGRSDTVSEAQINFLALPTEVLQLIYFYAESPQLSHVCRVLRHVFPSFVTYTIRAAEDAFGLGRIHYEEAIAALTATDGSWFRRGPNPIFATHQAFDDQMNTDRYFAQGLICEGWLTSAMLRKTRSRLVLGAVESFCELTKCEWNQSSRYSLVRYLASVHHDRFVPVIPGSLDNLLSDLGSSWCQSLMGEKFEYRLLVVNHIVFVYLGFSNTVGLVLQPCIPVQRLVHWMAPSISRLDARTQELAHELLGTRLPELGQIEDIENQPPERFSDPPFFNLRRRGTVGYLGKYITAVLDSLPGLQTKSLQSLAERCLGTLLSYNAPLQLHQWFPPEIQTLPRSQRDTTHLKDRPIYIEHKFYHHVILQRNVTGFKMLLAHNTALYNPSIHELKEMMWRTLLGHKLGSLNPPCPPPSQLHVQTNSLLEVAKASGQPEYLKMMNMVYKAAEHLGYRLPILTDHEPQIEPARPTSKRSRDGGPHISQFSIYEDSPKKRKKP